MTRSQAPGGPIGAARQAGEAENRGEGSSPFEPRGPARSLRWLCRASVLALCAVLKGRPIPGRGRSASKEEESKVSRRTRSSSCRPWQPHTRLHQTNLARSISAIGCSTYLQQTQEFARFEPRKTFAYPSKNTANAVTFHHWTRYPQPLRRSQATDSQKLAHNPRGFHCPAPGKGIGTSTGRSAPASLLSGVRDAQRTNPKRDTYSWLFASASTASDASVAWFTASPRSTASRSSR